MSFTIGLLELLGYVVPGATVLGITAFVYMGWRPWLGDSGGDSASVLYFVLASYVTGHILTILSRMLTWTHRKLRRYRSSREKRFAFYFRLRERLVRVFGSDFGPAEEYHLARELVTERCPRSSERIDRLFALTLLTRNMSMALLVAVWPLVSSGHRHWSYLSLMAAGLFAFQHYRFEGTHESAVFRAAFVALALPRRPDLSSTEADNGEG